MIVSCVLGLGFPHAGLAAQLTFTLDPSASHVTASALIVPVEGPLMPQGPGAAVSSYSGSVLVEVDDPFAPTSIQFLGGSVDAAITGDWLPEVGGGSSGTFLPGDADPGDPQPANYGLTGSQLGVGTLWLAFRDLVLSPTSTALPVSQNLFAAEQTFVVESGTADYAIRSVFFGDRNATEDLTDDGDDRIENMAPTSGSYSVENGLATIRLPIELFDSFEDESTGFELLELNFSGTITATAVLTQPQTADIDGDGDVDGDDLLDMLLGFGIDEGAARSEGDADSDGDVDRADVQIWQETAGSGVSPLVGTAVPEPSGILLILAAVTALLSLRRLGGGL